MRTNKDNLQHYISLAKDIRRTILDLVHSTGTPHIGSAFSCVEILVSLYFRIMNINPHRPLNPARDRFILSKGHACAGLYAILQKRGFLSKKDIAAFAVNNGRLELHPSLNVKKGIEATTGSLGHGLSIGAGMAYAAKCDKKKFKTYVLLSDGELNEGSTWEAVMFAGHHRLNNLIAIIDYNKMQAMGFTRDILDLEPLAEKWGSFGWKAYEVNGHDFKDLFDVLESARKTIMMPAVVIAHTVKGKGVSFMENNLLWHYRAPDHKEYKKALKELLR